MSRTCQSQYSRQLIDLYLELMSSHKKDQTSKATQYQGFLWAPTLYFSLNVYFYFSFISFSCSVQVHPAELFFPKPICPSFSNRILVQCFLFFLSTSFFQASRSWNTLRGEPFLKVSPDNSAVFAYCGKKSYTNSGCFGVCCYPGLIFDSVFEKLWKKKFHTVSLRSWTSLLR